MSKILVTKTFEFWTEARLALPRLLGGDKSGTTSIISKIWNVGKATPYRWGANRRTNEHWGYNPHDFLTNTHQELVETDNRWLVAASLRLLAEPFGFDVSDATVESDRAYPYLELLDIQAALGRLADQHGQHIADDDYTCDEQARDLCLVDSLIKQAEEMKASIRRCGNE